MSDTKAAAGLTPEQWDDKFFVEHIQKNRFAGEMGNDENSVIQVKEDLSVKAGDTIHYALVNRLKEDGQENGGTLEGNEEDMDSRSFKLKIKERAHGVRSNRWQAQLSAIDLRKAAKQALKTWSMENTRDQIITALGSINGVAYGSASEAQKDAWLTDNADRVLFGAAKSNNSGNDHSASLANIDATNDKFTAAKASLMKRIARSASPKIAPVMSSSGGRYYYIVYLQSLVFRDLKDDPVITQAQRDVGLRMQNEKLFKGGDIEWDGMIFKEIEDIAVLSGVGAAGIDVGPAYFCGAQALGYGIAERWKSEEELFDYKRKKGCAIMEMGGFAKLTFGTGDDVDVDDTVDPKDHGMVTGFFAAVPDA